MANFFKFRLTGMEGMSAALRQLPRALGDAVLKKALTTAAGPVVEYAQANASFIDRTGRLRRGRWVTPMRRRRYGSEIALGPTAPEAHLVEFGTKPHRIEARAGGVLSWLGIAAKYVQHPGAKPKPFFRKAWDLKGGPAMLADLGSLLWAELAAAAGRLRSRAASGKVSARTMDELA